MSSNAQSNADESSAIPRPDAVFARELAPDDRRNFVAWIPIIVPGLAVIVATCAYLIGWGVLAS